ncbi:hypothetical protein BpHYR1_000386 [Brachionus plicatilis]|uniref:Uncharacterized protein n=1 Tax=Brachionus plicatilis TaxID=10195 RepID=A0A3M7Q6A9_BRAPC|nr:hypothetical protein BpHYR1_000386 [Brachionus plicatilis]
MIRTRKEKKNYSESLVVFGLKRAVRPRLVFFLCKMHRVHLRNNQITVLFCLFVFNSASALKAFEFFNYNE